jgi:hypothetical protein
MGLVLSILGFLKSPLGRGVGIGAAFLLVLASCGVQSARLKSAKADLRAARAALYVPDAAGRPTKVTWKAAHGACMKSVGDLSKSLEDQSEKVKAQAQAATAALAQAEKLAGEAQKGRAAAEKKAASLAALVKDFRPGTCADPNLAAADAAVLEMLK